LSATAIVYGGDSFVLVFGGVAAGLATAAAFLFARAGVRIAKSRDSSDRRVHSLSLQHAAIASAVFLTVGYAWSKSLGVAAIFGFFGLATSALGAARELEPRRKPQRPDAGATSAAARPRSRRG
jgi:hypothetical protein